MTSFWMLQGSLARLLAKNNSSLSIVQFIGLTKLVRIN